MFQRVRTRPSIGGGEETCCLSWEGEVKLADFGVAQMIERIMTAGVRAEDVTDVLSRTCRPTTAPGRDGGDVALAPGRQAECAQFRTPAADH